MTISSQQSLEPRLVIFESEDFILQTFISAENDCLVEVPATTIVEGLVYLMAVFEDRHLFLIFRCFAPFHA